MDEEELECFEDAQDNVHWQQTMKKELNSIEKNKTWNLVDLPPSKKAIGTRWVYKLKRTLDGFIDRYKAKLVVKGYA